MPTSLASLLGSTVKSIQRGTLSIPAYSGAVGTATATVTAVTTSKSRLTLLGAHVASGSGSNAPNASIVLTNSTTITGTNGMSSAVVVSWELVETY